MREQIDDLRRELAKVASQLVEMEKRLAAHVVGSIAIGTLVLLGVLLGLASVLIQKG